MKAHCGLSCPVLSNEREGSRHVFQATIRQHLRSFSAGAEIPPCVGMTGGGVSFSVKGDRKPESYPVEPAPT